MDNLPDSLALSLPPEWEVVPLEPSEFSVYMRNQLQHLAEMNALSRSDLRSLEVIASLINQLARQQNVISISNYVAIEETQDDEDDATGVLVNASLVVSTIRRSDLDTDMPLLAEVLVQTFSDGVPTDYEGVRFSTIEPPAVCEVNGNRAAKLVRLMTVGDSLSEEHRQFLQTYMVPVANGDAIFVLQFSTSNFQYAKQFSELFDKIAGTLRILFPDDPTFLDEETDRSD